MPVRTAIITILAAFSLLSSLAAAILATRLGFGLYTNQFSGGGGMVILLFQVWGAVLSLAGIALGTVALHFRASVGLVVRCFAIGGSMIGLGSLIALAAILFS